MRQLIKLLGYIISYFYTTHLNQRVQGIISSFYTGWRSRDFKRFKGHITGHIEVRGGQYITIGDNTIIEDGVLECHKPGVVIIGENNQETGHICNEKYITE